MGRFATSWTLLKSSWAVLKQDKELLWMPVLSFLASVAAVGSIAGVGVFAALNLPENEQTSQVFSAVWFGSMYLALAFVATYFHAATVGAAWQRLSGGDPTVGSALREANKHLGKLFAWSVILATVNILLSILRREGGTLGRIAASIAGGAWNLATYFVVPTLMYADEGVGASLRTSVGIFRRRWGETIVGHAGLGLAMGLITVLWLLLTGLLAFALFAVAGPAGGVAGLIVLGAGALLLLLTGSVLGAIYKTALYRFATAGASGTVGFDDRALANAAY